MKKLYLSLSLFITCVTATPVQAFWLASAKTIAIPAIWACNLKIANLIDDSLCYTRAQINQNLKITKNVLNDSTDEKITKLKDDLAAIPNNQKIFHTYKQEYTESLSKELKRLQHLRKNHGQLSKEISDLNNQSFDLSKIENLHTFKNTINIGVASLIPLGVWFCSQYANYGFASRGTDSPMTQKFAAQTNKYIFPTMAIMALPAAALNLYTAYKMNNFEKAEKATLLLRPSDCEKEKDSDDDKSDSTSNEISSFDNPPSKIKGLFFYNRVNLKPEAINEKINQDNVIMQDYNSDENNEYPFFGTLYRGTDGNNCYMNINKPTDNDKLEPSDFWYIAEKKVKP